MAEWSKVQTTSFELIKNETDLLIDSCSGDDMSLVRIWCYCGRIEEAITIASTTTDKAAAYHLGKLYHEGLL